LGYGGKVQKGSTKQGRGARHGYRCEDAGLGRLGQVLCHSMALGRRRRAIMVEGYRAHLGLQIGEVGMQVCGFPRWSKSEIGGSLAYMHAHIAWTWTVPIFPM
jgi:hypothetical protein